MIKKSKMTLYIIIAISTLAVALLLVKTKPNHISASIKIEELYNESSSRAYDLFSVSPKNRESLLYVSMLNVTIIVTPDSQLYYSNIMVTSPTTPDLLANACAGKSIDLPPGSTPKSISCYISRTDLATLSSRAQPLWFSASIVGYNVYRGNNDDVATTEPVEVTIVKKYCYQENPLNIYDCGATTVGMSATYDAWTSAEVSKMRDDNWDTYGVPNANGEWRLRYMMPTSARTSSLFQIKDNDGIKRLSIPTECWTPGCVYFRIGVCGSPVGSIQTCNFPKNTVILYCNRDTSLNCVGINNHDGMWVEMERSSYTETMPIYDTAMIWDIIP